MHFMKWPFKMYIHLEGGGDLLKANKNEQGEEKKSHLIVPPRKYNK